MTELKVTPRKPVEFDRFRETSRRRSAVELLLSMGYVWATDHWEARKQTDAAGDGDAADLFGMAQLAPGEGIEDAVRRIDAYLAARQPVGAEPAGWLHTYKKTGESSLATYPVDMNLAFNRERWECVALYAAPAAVQMNRECGNCHEGKSDMDHDCRECGGTGRLPSTPAAAKDGGA
ncbi:P32 [Xanthomonas phage phiL7]|uniref:p32 n=1 Tax=Xanthomonas phage phiL7 TaxID=538979 RepID=C4ML32_9CAUD|nr:P32 [Xanthomonas phage phiL7]ACE75772.1 P32 [Xanthomonas phage phiL7]